MKKRIVAGMLSLLMMSSQILPSYAAQQTVSGSEVLSEVSEAEITQSENNGQEWTDDDVSQNDISQAEILADEETEEILQEISENTIAVEEVSVNEVSGNEIVTGASAPVVINESSFPDDGFRQYISSPVIDQNEDGILSVKEQDQVTEINLNLYGAGYSDPDSVNPLVIRSLEGITIFSNLNTLDCSYNKISELDLSGCRNLVILNCADNPLKKLVLTSCTKIQQVSIQNTQLPFVEIPNRNGIVNAQTLESQAEGMLGTTAVYFSSSKTIKVSDLGMDSTRISNANMTGGTYRNGVITINDNASQVNYGYLYNSTKDTFEAFAIRYLAGSGVELSFEHPNNGNYDMLNTIGLHVKYAEESRLCDSYRLFRKIDDGEAVRLDEAWTKQDIINGKSFMDAVPGGTAGKKLTYYLTDAGNEAEKLTDEIVMNLYSFDNSDELETTFRNTLVNRTKNQFLLIRKDIFDAAYQNMYHGYNEVANFESALYDTYRERELMKPWEGEYLAQQVGENTTGTYLDITQYEYFSFWHSTSDTNSEEYLVFRVTPKFMTTPAQESQVDAKVEKIVNSPDGELYKYKTASDYEKVKACYNYVRSHVSYLSNGEWITHSCYAALINGKGTCQAYSLLYYRLLREFGISNKILMGTDAGAHTYNIVKVGESYYYSDPSQSSFSLKGEKNFSHAPLQERFLTEDYQKAYLSKISSVDYNKNADPAKVASVDILYNGLRKNGQTLLLNARSQNAVLSLSANILPQTASNKTVEWKSANPSIAVVSADGSVSASGIGETTITVISKENSRIKASCKVKVVSQMEGLTITGPDVLGYGKSAVLSAMIVPDSATLQNVKWASSNPEIITVSQKPGKTATIKGKAYGTAWIRATAADGSEQSAELQICVLNPVKTIKLMQGEREVTKQTLELDAKNQSGAAAEIVLDAVAFDKTGSSDVSQKLKWSSQKAGKVSIRMNESGQAVITAKEPGKTVVKATAEDGSKAYGQVTIQVVQSGVTICGSSRVAAGKTLNLRAAGPKVSWSLQEITPESERAKMTLKNGKLVLKRDAAAGTRITVRAEAVNNPSLFDEHVVITCAAVDGLQITAEDGRNVTNQQVGFDRDRITSTSNNRLYLNVRAAGSSESADTEIEWKSANPKVAVIVTSLDGQCTIQAVKAGKTVITATCADGSKKKAKTTLVVASLADSLTIQGGNETNTIQAGSEQLFTARITPAWAESKKVSWTCETISGVSLKKGKLKVKAGVPSGTKITITATAEDGSNAKSYRIITVE